MPLHDVLPHQRRGEAGGKQAGRPRMKRRDFIRTSSILAVRLVATQAGLKTRLYAGQIPAGPYPDPDCPQLDSWIVIKAHNTATFFVGKTDLGQGTGTAFRQIMSDELDT